MNLQEIRKAKKMTQKQLSERSGISLRVLQSYEVERRSIDGAGLDVLCALALALDVHIPDILESEQLKEAFRKTL